MTTQKLAVAIVDFMVLNRLSPFSHTQEEINAMFIAYHMNTGLEAAIYSERTK